VVDRLLFAPARHPLTNPKTGVIVFSVPFAARDYRKTQSSCSPTNRHTMENFDTIFSHYGFSEGVACRLVVRADGRRE